MSTPVVSVRAAQAATPWWRRSILSVRLFFSMALLVAVAGSMVVTVAPAQAATGADIADIAHGQLGKHCSGNGWACDPDAWCADFANWVWSQAGIDTGGISAGAGSFVLYGNARGTITDQPHVGDAVVYKYNGNGWAPHVNLVYAVRSDGWIQTIGGNQGASPGVVSLDNWHRPDNYDGSVTFVRPVGVTQGQATGPFYHDIRQADGSWQGWIGLAGVNGAPSFSGSQEAITGLPDGSTQLVGIGIDGNIYHNIRSGSGSWQGWVPVAGFNGAPNFNAKKVAIAGLPDGSTQFIATGVDGNIYHNVRAATGSWQGWVPVAGFNGAPNFNAGSLAITGLPDGSTQMTATGVDGNIYHNVRAATGSWQGWIPVAGFNGAPNFNAKAVAIAGLPDGSAQFIATGIDGNIYHNVRAATGSWQGWIPVAGFNGAPNFNASAVAMAGLSDGSTQMLAVGVDGNVYHNIRSTTGSWQGWIGVQGAAGAPTFNATGVSIAALPDNSTQLVAIGH